MANENEVIENQAPPPVENQAPVENQTPPVENQTPPVETPAPNAIPNWAQARIDQITREKWEERRANEHLRAENERLRVNGQTPPDNQQQQPGLTNADIDRMVNVRAQEQRRIDQFNEQCNTVYQNGKKENTDWDATIGNFNMLGGLAAHPALVEATTAIPDGHKVLYHLGKNLDEAQRIMALPPLKMAIELTNIGARMALPVNRMTNAPAPTQPINTASGNVGAPGPDDKGDFANQADYKAWRDKQFANSTRRR